MLTKKKLPCSLYDFEGLQSWLDEMALQGLFFQSFSKRNDTANFWVDTPRPVRYRLDPVGKNKKKDQERKEPYARMGWEFVDTLPQMYYIFSCEDPDVPELHSDPQTLAYALNNTIQKQIKVQTVGTLLLGLFIVVMLFVIRKSLFQELLLMEHPRLVFQLCFTLVMFLIGTVIPIFQIRMLVQTRRLLEQGLLPKAGRRWDRPKFLVVYWCIMVPFLIIAHFVIPYYLPEVFGLEERVLSHSWPTLAQLEETGPRPLEDEPEVDGYLELNHSWFVPVQEFVSVDWTVRDFNDYTGAVTERPRPYKLWMTVQYHQARSPWAARQVYRFERDDKAEFLNNCLEWNGAHVHITQLDTFAPMEHPGLDRLEVARFQRSGQEGWAFAALRGTEVLVVEYTGYASLEDGLELFLQAMG